MENFWSAPAWYVAVVLVYVAFLLVVAGYDLRRRRVPNAAVYPALAAALVIAPFHPLGPWWGFVVGGVFAATVLAAIAFASRGAMGLGDVKLATVIGLMAGWPGVVIALLIAFGGGAIAGVALLASGRIGRQEPIPFAPALAFGACVTLLAGPQIAAVLWPGM
jgi:prepilin signal peptidase PulO-like enzyme (type II secretory pathway)